MRARRSVLVLVASAALLAGCTSGGGADGGARPPQVVTTVAPLTSIVASVAGGHANVTGLVPEGVDSHTFEPPPSAAETLSDADVIVVNGLALEDPTLELAEQTAPEDAEIVKLGDRVLPRDKWIFDFSFPRADGKPNPHLWTDPPYAIRYAEVARDVLAERDPNSAADYRRNAAAFVGKATELSQAVRTASATVPRRELLTYHDAYAYFARDYGWRVIGAVQPKNFEDPTPREVAALIRQVRERRVPAIFGSEVFPSRVLEQIGRETGARYEDTLRDDDLPGKPGDPEHSWLGLMRYNFATMVRGLGGDPSAIEAVRLDGLPTDRAVYPQ